jgi:hypothetical protein
MLNTPGYIYARLATYINEASLLYFTKDLADLVIFHPRVALLLSALFFKYPKVWGSLRFESEKPKAILISEVLKRKR